MSDAKVTIVTMRTSDSDPVPESLGETQIMTCDRCGSPVYITSTTWDRIREDEEHESEIVCNICIIPAIEKQLSGEVEEVEIRPADRSLEPLVETPERREEFLRFMLDKA